MTALLLLAVLVLVFVNGFFVAAEFALVRVRPNRLEELAADGRRGAALALKIHEDLNEYLSACQFGITLASLGIGFLGEPAIAELVEPLLGDTISHGLAVVISIAIAYIIVTAAHITVGEQVPKIYAIVRPEDIAVRVARPLRWFNIGMRPFIAALNAASNGMLRAVKINPDAELEDGPSPEELRVLIGKWGDVGRLDPGEAVMLSGVFHLHEQEARQIMTPIPAVVTVDTSEDVETALRRCISSGHTRLLVTEDDNQDRVKGIVHSNSLARQLMAEGPQASIETLVKDAPIVPETKPLDDLLADLQRNRSSMAVVVDEYGRVAGIVTVEDIVEEIVGEIADETDRLAAPVRRLPNGHWFARGDTSLDDLLDYGIQLPPGSYNSVGGLVFDRLGRLAEPGDVVHVEEYELRVGSVSGNRIETVDIRPRPQDTAPVED